jgi:hypothetical protein
MQGTQTNNRKLNGTEKTPADNERSRCTTLYFRLTFSFFPKIRL